MSDTDTLTRAVLTTDGQVLVEQPDGSYRPAKGETDWSRVDRMGDAELEAAIAADPDDPGNDPGFWDRARLVYPSKQRVTLRLDADVLDWFRRQGRGYQARINAILRRHYEDPWERHDGNAPRGSSSVKSAALRLMIDDRVLRAIGHVAAQWAYLENQLDFCLVIFMAQPRASELRRDIPTSFDRRARLLKKCANVVLEDSPHQLGRVERIIGEASSLKGRRDEVVHGQWRLKIDSSQDLKPAIDILRMQRRASPQTKMLSADQTESIANRIGNVTAELVLFIQELTNDSP